jgi:hypothetical protein
VSLVSPTPRTAVVEGQGVAACVTLHCMSALDSSADHWVHPVAGSMLWEPCGRHQGVAAPSRHRHHQRAECEILCRVCIASLLVALISMAFHVSRCVWLSSRPTASLEAPDAELYIRNASDLVHPLPPTVIPYPGPSRSLVCLPWRAPVTTGGNLRFHGFCWTKARTSLL